MQEKPDFGKIDMELIQAKQFGVVDITRNLTNVIELLKTQAMLKGIHLSKQFEANVPLIRCDSNRLEQVFINVIKNAIEAVSEQTGQVLVRVNRPTDDEITVIVGDNGPGIASEQMTHLGEPFYTTKDEGTGLGLMISQKIVNEHHGRLEIQSDSECGTTVTITLPLNCERP